MSNNLKFDDIIMNIFRNKALECYMEVVGGYLTKTENNKIYMYIGSLQYFIGRKSSMKVLMLYIHISMLKNNMRQYLSNILKWDTHSDYTKEKIYHWLDYFEKFHKQYIIMATESYNSSVPEESRY